MKSTLSISEIRQLDCYELARMADVTSPDRYDSPGAELLKNARDWYLEHREGIHGSRYPEDEMSEVSGINANNGGAVDYRTYQMMLAFTDLCLWQFELGDDGILGEITWDGITNVIAIVEGEVALRLVHELHGADDFADLISDDEEGEAAGGE